MSTGKAELKNEFLSLYKANISRDGADKLLDFLLFKSDFFEAPASTRFHSAYAGGLCDHSVKTYRRFVRLLESEYGQSWQEKISLESATIIALLHDICKTNYYKVDYRNAKNEFGEWERRPYYSVDDALPYGHGEKSVYMIGGFMRLTREEAVVINWHMGAFDNRFRGGDYSLNDAFAKFPLALLFHVADSLTTYLDEPC